MTRDTKIDIEARLVTETPYAWLLDTGEDDPTWINKETAKFDGRTLRLREAHAIEKGLV